MLKLDFTPLPILLFVVATFAVVPAAGESHSDLDKCRAGITAKDYKQAFPYCKKAAEQGYANAQYNLGQMYRKGEGVAEDDREAVRWYRKAAEQGFAQAQNNLGAAYENGEGVAEDGREAVRWYRKAAGQGYALAQNNLGDMYDNGEGVAEDDREAVRWYLKAAEQGHAKAQYNLGVLYANGHGVAKDDREAVRWYRKAAEQGYAKAQLNLGWMYDKGDGVAEDDREAMRWFRKAAEQGIALAQFNLGWMYQNGKGVAEDDREAVRWYRKSAEQGFASAQHNLGVMYENGEGVAEDDREAVQWFRKAAEQGLAQAQNNLGAMYWSGEGVITDKQESYIWFSIAKANGNERAAKGLRELKWHNYLSSAEIKTAQKEAARRLAAIDQRQEETAEKPDIGDGIAFAKPPKGANIAEKVFENTWRSVVVIEHGDSQGSGVVIRPNIVATNCHVVDDIGEIIVYKSDNRKADNDTPFLATVRKRDDDSDFCLLDVENLWGIAVTIRKYETLNIGEDVYGLGAPQGLDLSLSSGLISQLRTANGKRFIQTDAAISPGSSGGGLFDSDNNLIGIMTFKFVDEQTEGIGFAIPADLVLDF